jgi:hypothetical protein
MYISLGSIANCIDSVAIEGPEFSRGVQRLVNENLRSAYETNSYEVLEAI